MYSSERLMDKIEFEELALRRVDLALGSNMWWGAEGKEGGLGNGFGGSDPDPMHPILRSHCSTHRHLCPPSAVLDHLRQYVEYRTMHHKKGR